MDNERAQWGARMLALLEPLKARLTPAGSGFDLGATAAHYETATIPMEAFSRHVWVRGCYIDGTDDNLCLQSSGLPVQDVHISDCAFTSVCAGIRIGLKSIGEISNVVISNCTMRNVRREGIKLECTEGGSITDV